MYQSTYDSPFAVKFDRCVGSCNTLNDLSNKLFIPNKTEDLNLSVFNIITCINELQTLTKNISCKRRVQVEKNASQINSGIMINVNVV